MARVARNLSQFRGGPDAPGWARFGTGGGGRARRGRRGAHLGRGQRAGPLRTWAVRETCV